jgi:hypothetical protein
MTFLAEHVDMWDVILHNWIDIGDGVDPFRVNRPELANDLLVPLHRRLGAIQVFRTRAAFDRANKAWDVLHQWFVSAERPTTLEDVTAARDAYVDQVRRDLHVSDE